MKLTQQQLEAHLWGAATILRGRTAGQDYKNYILSLMFYKRLCDQWSCEAEEVIAEQEKLKGSPLTDKQRERLLARGDHRFAIPTGSHWNDVLKVSKDIGKKLTAAMRAIANANKELVGVFTVDWNQPAPDGKGKKLIPEEVVHALVQQFHEIDLSNQSVPADVLGRAYEYLIKQFADDAGAKAGEFFTPPEVVDTLVRILEPIPGDTIYDPTCGAGGMLVHSADYLKELGHRADAARYFGQEMNWATYAIAKINSILHGMDADIRGGESTITSPQFLERGKIKRFDVAIANFPFSDELWWLQPDQQAATKKKRDKLKKDLFGAEGGYKDSHGRFGRGTAYAAPPAGYGDYAFILHIVASLTDNGRAGIVCPQGVLFRGQPAIEEETGELNADGTPKVRRRKADDEHLIRHALLESRLVDAVIALPLNVFYGAGVPACLLILRKDRSAARKKKLLLVYAARHYRELSNQNELRPQDIMRMLVHYHAYGDAKKVPKLAKEHRDRLHGVIDHQEAEDVARLDAEYQEFVDKLAELNGKISEATDHLKTLTKKGDRSKQQTKINKLEKASEKPTAKLAERDEKIAEVRRRAAEDRDAIDVVAEELISLYDEPDELVRHARVVDVAEIEENEHNLNVPRYVDTFEPEPVIEVADALEDLRIAEKARVAAEKELAGLLRKAGYTVEVSKC